MRKHAAKTPFRWSRALACIVGCAAGACAVLALLTGLHPDVMLGDYIIAGGFGSIVGLLVYAGRNQKSQENRDGIYDPTVGSMADFGAGTGTSSWGRMGQNDMTIRRNEEASRRLHD